MSAKVQASPPLVSVLLAVYNGASHLEESVQSILGQSFAGFEFIIVDDGSTDASAEIIAAAAKRDSRIRVLTNDRNLGLAATLNRALRIAAGAYIARQDADDISTPDRLFRQLAMFEADPSLVLVGSAYRVIDTQGRFVCQEQHPLNDIPIRWHMLFHNAFIHSSVMFRADLVQRHSLYYDERLRYAQDYDLWSRFLDYGPGANCACPLIRYRVYDLENRKEMFREQQENATAISRRNLAKLGIAVSDQELARLRRPDAESAMSAAGTEKLRSQVLLLQIISRFADLRPDAASQLALVRWRLCLGSCALRKSGVSWREILALVWGFSRLDTLSVIQAALSAIYLKLSPAACGGEKPGGPGQVENHESRV